MAEKDGRQEVSKGTKTSVEGMRTWRAREDDVKQKMFIDYRWTDWTDCASKRLWKLKRCRPNVKGACEQTSVRSMDAKGQAEHHAKRQCPFRMRNKSVARPNKTTPGVTVKDQCRQLLSHSRKIDDQMGVTWLWSSHHPDPAGIQQWGMLDQLAPQPTLKSKNINEPHFCSKEKTW